MPEVHLFKPGEGESFENVDSPKTGDYLRFNRIVGGVRMAQQQTQIDRQEQIIHALKDQLQRQQQQSGSQQGARSRPGSGIREPQDLIRLQNENGKLRELVQLLQEKLHDAQNGEAEDEY